MWPGEQGNWHFVSVDKATTEAIDTAHKSRKRGFGSLRVEATIGGTTWLTSIFPESHSHLYMLPVKAKVRHKERIAEGDMVTLTLKILV